MAAAKATEEESLRRLGGGRWQTRDERFTIEPQSGTWAIVDAEQTDELGLPLVRGPYATLTAAKSAIAEARESAAPASPLKDRPKPAAERPESPAKTSPRDTGKQRSKAREPDEPEEPRWFRDLAPDDRRRASRLIERLTASGADDPENLVRRDLVGEVPAIAAYAIARAVRALGDDASAADVAELLGEGRDSELGVRWRLVDEDGRPIRLEARDLESA
ncbi:MAG TPA: hypothetical protein VFN41_12700 [Candidatus Limnocylindrales bacterium]|nr:hypothetical protein [Candidatus Limnocylindrales bacterium]